MTSSLTNKNISDTYLGVLHAQGETLPANFQREIYDGAGQQSALSLGRKEKGITVTGGITTNGNVRLTTGTSTATTAIWSAIYPKVEFGGFDNTDTMFITRNNTGPDSSQLRACIGDNVTATKRSDDSFVVGGFDWTGNISRDFIPLTTIENNGNMRVQLAAHPTLYKKPSAWAGGVTSFDFYSDGGTFGAGLSGSLNAYFKSDGNFVGKTYSSTSSIKYKTNVAPLEDALTIINKLEGVRFDWKETGKSDIGLIAEQVNEVLPEFVFKDEKGETQGVDYGKITSVLIEAVKELTKLINANNGN
jgi:hypothetical protein